jgi:hypothetical protein
LEEVKMYRYRNYVVVKYGQFRQHKELIDELEALCEKKGLTRSTAWVPVAGEDNAFISETDYPDLATLDRETAQFFSDAEVMSIWRKAAALIIEGSGRSELLTRPPDLA